MNLHHDRDAFQVLINLIHERTGYREDVLEKDYYVCLILKDLAEKQKDGLPAYFKGGTALYKALKTTRRFSEDIDLSVDTRDCNRTQNAKLLERSTKKYKDLERMPELGRTNRSEVISVYQYKPVSVYDAEDALQRFGKLKVEATSFTISEPVEELEVAPILYEMASLGQREILERNYDVKPFMVKTITLERIFIDKLFAAESYVRRSADSHRAFEAAKHIYDLTVLKDNEKIKTLMSNEQQMFYLLNIRMTEEKERLDGMAEVSPKMFVFFTRTEENDAVRKAYEIMQRQYVLRDEDRIPFEQAVRALSQIQTQLMDNRAWCNYDIMSDKMSMEIGKKRGGNQMHIGHVAMYVNDLERAKDFFVRYFHATANGGYHNKTTDFRSYFLSFDDGARLELMHKPDMTDASKPLARTGYAHIAFCLGSREAVDCLSEAMRADGYEVISGPRVTGDGYYESCIVDVEGNQIELTV